LPSRARSRASPSGGVLDVRARRLVAERRSWDPAHIGVDAAKRGADVCRQVRADRPPRQAARAAPEGRAIAQRFLRGRVGRRRFVRRQPKQLIGRGHDVFDLRAGSCLEDRQRVNQDRRVAESAPRRRSAVPEQRGQRCSHSRSAGSPGRRLAEASAAGCGELGDRRDVWTCRSHRHDGRHMSTNEGFFDMSVHHAGQSRGASPTPAVRLDV